MASGDGLVVRVRPRAGCLSPAQALAIADAASRHGNGIVDLTSRANVQIRGVSETSHAALVAELAASGLIDSDVVAETRRNVVVTPFGTRGERAETLAIAAALEMALADVPVLPSKFGFAIDTGATRLLAGISADIRIERDVAGRLMVRADGAVSGLPVTADAAATTAARLATWFIASGGAPGGRGRMARHLARGASLPADLAGNAHPASAATEPSPGTANDGLLVGAEFGQMRADWLAALSACCGEIRVTPWRMLLLVDARTLPEIRGLVTTPGDPRRHVTACSGAPACPQAIAPTRGLAHALAAFVPTGAHLHVTGCAKCCAMPGPAPYILLATSQGFSLYRGSSASGTPVRTGLAADAIAADPSLVFELG